MEPRWSLDGASHRPHVLSLSQRISDMRKCFHFVTRRVTWSLKGSLKGSSMVSYFFLNKRVLLCKCETNFVSGGGKMALKGWTTGVNAERQSKMLVMVIVFQRTNEAAPLLYQSMVEHLHLINGWEPNQTD